jgi:Putative beta-barrel porin-2, OmpL-like. bbp2
MATGLILLAVPAVRAADPNGEAAAAPAAPAAKPAPAPDPAERVDALEKTVQQLQAELAEVKKQLKESASTAPAGKATAEPAAVTAPAASAEAAPAAMPAAAPTAPAPSPAAAPEAKPSAFDSIAINGFVDGYYGYNFQHPQGPGSTQVTPFRAFAGPTNTLELNMIELGFLKAPTASDRLGFNVTFGYGNAMNVVNSTDYAGLGFAQYLKEGYLSYLAPVGKGLQIDFGKFVTPEGAEVIETNGNWNYSRGILFTYAIPFYHFGFRTKYNFSDKANASFFLVNGWNNIQDNNTGKTVGFQLGLNPTKKLSIIQNYMVGPEQTGVNSNVRNLIDTIVTYNPTSKLSLMWNFDYGRETPVGTSTAMWWSGIASYAKYAFNDSYAFAARYEFYDDHSGYTTGAAQDLNEFTLTLDRTISKHLLTRWEFRRDMSNYPSMLRGSVPTDSQNTISGGLIYAFDIHDAQ